jgi:WD40 repeat protein
VVVRDVETGDVKFALPGQQFFFAGMAFSPDGKKIATGDSDSAVRLWDASTGKLLQTFPRRYGIVSRLSFSPEGDRLGTATGAGTVRYDRSLTVWDLSRGNEVFDLPLHNNDIRAIEFTPDGRRILSCSVDKTLSICDAATGQFLLSLPLGDSSTRFAILPEQRGLALLTERNAVEFRDATRGREPFVLIPDERVPKSVPFERVAFSDDGNELLTLDSDEMVHGWNPATGASLPEKPRTMPPGAGTSAVSADGRIRARVVRGLVRVEPLPEIVEDAKRSRRLLSQWAEVDAAFHSRAAVESLSKADWFAARWHLSAWLKTQPAAVE